MSNTLFFCFYNRLGDELEVSLVSEDISDRMVSHGTGDSDDLISNEDVRLSKDRKVWSREAFTHETAGMGGPDREVRPRYLKKKLCLSITHLLIINNLSTQLI